MAQLPASPLRRSGARGTLVRGTIVVLLMVLACTACGRLSKKEYIRQGDAICRATNAAVDKTPVPAKTDVRATADYLRTTSKLLLAQVDRLSALKAPKVDEPRLADVYQRERDALTQLQTAANQFQLGGETTAQVTANQADSALIEVRQDLQGYGFQDCANQ